MSKILRNDKKKKNGSSSKVVCEGKWLIITRVELKKLCAGGHSVKKKNKFRSNVKEFQIF